MPDSTRKTVSASQMAVVLNRAPVSYGTRFTLWAEFTGKVPRPERDSQRMAWGRLQQKAILKATEMAYRLKVEDNTGRNRYQRRAPLGHTRDGLMFRPDLGKVVVEAKNVDWLVWKKDWTEASAAEHVEIQVQTGMYADDANHAVIAALIGGNDIKWYQREPNRELQQLLVEEATLFLEQVKGTRPPPEPLGEAVEIPAVAALYDTIPDQIYEDMASVDLREMLRTFKWAREQRKFAEKTEDTLKPKILALAQGAGMIRANSMVARIARRPVEETKAPNPEIVDAALGVLRVALKKFGEDVTDWPPVYAELFRVMEKPWRVARKAYIQTIIDIDPVEGDPKLPGDDVVADAARVAEKKGMAA